MKQKLVTPLLALSLLMPFSIAAQEEQASNYDNDTRELSAANLEQLKSKKCKKFCTISARRACIGDLRVNDLTVDNSLTVGGNVTIDGGLTVGGTDFTSLINIVNILNSGSPLVRSVVPFSSGLITLAGAPVFPEILEIPTTGLVMGFGNSTLLTTAPNLIPQETGFAFSVPEAGTIYNLRVSVDTVFAVGFGGEGLPFTFTFTVLQSPCVDGTLSGYTATALTATAVANIGEPLPSFPLADPTAGVTGCGSNAAGIPVAAGDRITIRVTPNDGISAEVLALVAFSAGFDYAPTL